MTPERIRTFSKHDQMLFVGSEFERARVWQIQDKEKFLGALARADELVRLIMHDPKWNADMAQLEGLLHEIEKFRKGGNKQSVAILYQAL